jgi:hypothetical protein
MKYTSCFCDLAKSTNSAESAEYRELTRTDEGRRDAYLRTVAAAVVDTVHAPPAMTFLHALQFQIPTAVLFTESWSTQC